MLCRKFQTTCINEKNSSANAMELHTARLNSILEAMSLNTKRAHLGLLFSSETMRNWIFRFTKISTHQLESMRNFLLPLMHAERTK